MGSFLANPLSHRLSPLFLCLLFVLGVNALPVWIQPDTWTKTMQDPDGILRLVVVENLIQTGDWADHTIHRTNPPTGTVTPWTRPVDVLLLAGYAPLRLIFDEKQALIGSAMIMPPLLFVLALALLWRWMVGQGMTVYAQLFVLMGLVFNPMASKVFQPGAADHHGLLLVCSWFQFVFTYSLIQGQGRYAVPLGLITGLGIWVSPEFFMVTALCLAALGVCWLRRPDSYHAPLFKMLGTTTLVLVVAVLIEQPSFWVPFYDTVSVIYVCFLGLLTLGFWALKRVQNHDFYDRFLFSIGTLVLILGIMLFFYPEFYKLTMGGLDPYIIHSFLPQVSEQMPLAYAFKDIFPPQPWVGILAINLFFIGGYVFFFRRLKTSRDTILPVDSPELFVVFYATVTLVLGLSVARLYGYGVLPALFLFLPFLMFLVKTPKVAGLSNSLRAASVFLLSALPFVALALLTFLGEFWPSNKSAPDTCDDDLRVFVQQSLVPALPPAPLVLIHNNAMPALLFWTPYTALAGNYHREPRALEDLDRFFEAKTEGEAQSVIQKHRPDAVVVCTKDARPDRWIYDIATGKKPLPAGMHPIPTDEKAHPNIQMYGFAH